ncbi:hypothetical protein BDZ91DRAFT_444523 [Kalaharituber pfeilii]|nr:hypothetical protein BDZ91DRAFT_444523 [Kalaharituber pfeilii]
MWPLAFSNHHTTAPLTAMTQQESSSFSSQEQQVEPKQLQLTTVPSSGPTLLPSRVASLISMFSKSTTLSIRLSSIIGQLIIDSARTTTLSSLELARAGIEGVLLRAYNDVEARRINVAGGSTIDHGWTESMLTKLHATITFSQLLISTGFEASATGLNAVKELSQGWIYVIDSIFGETESSRAINSILSLIIQEFGTTENKKHEGPSVGVLDLLAGLACFAILQKRGRRRRAKEIRTEVIWDVVVGDFGSSLIRDRNTRSSREKRSRRPSLVKLGSSAPSVMTHTGLVQGKDDEWSIVRGDGSPMSVCSDDSDYSYVSDAGSSERRMDPAMLSKEELAEWLKKLPPAAQASITSTTTTTQRTTIEVSGINKDYKGHPLELDFIAPKDAVILAEESHHGFGEPGGGVKKYRVVYETVHKKVKGRKVLHDGESGRVIVEETHDSEIDHDNDDSDLVMVDSIPRITPVRKSSGYESDSTAKPSETSKKAQRSREKHAQLDGSKKSEKDKTKDKKQKDKRNKEKGKEKGKEKEKGKDKDRGREREREKVRDKEKNKKKENKSKDKERKDKGIRKAVGSIIHSPNQPPLLTPPSPGSRWKSGQTDYFSMTPSSADPPYTASVKRSSSVTRTSTSTLYTTSNSRADTYITRSDSFQTSIPSGTQLRRTFSREILQRPEPSVISPRPSSPHQGRTTPYAPSIHTLRTSLSQMSLSLEFISSGGVTARDDMMGRSYYPHDHLCRNMSKFMRFSSASYGSNFMRFLGIGSLSKASGSALNQTMEHHAEHRAFSHHTSLPVDTILLSSFTNPGGGYDMHGDVNTGVPLVHYICVDHKAKAVVLTCRGTLGLDDVVTDLTCEYGEMEVRGKTYKVHKGMLNSALLLLKTRREQVLITIRDALNNYEGYGLVLCGHSLGGGVAAILSILLSTPTSRGGFVTSNTIFQDVRLPEGRPIHCYAYGSPACVCSKLRIETRGLITSVVHGRDIVPSLSFGMIRDFHSVALAFKEDRQGIRREIAKTVLGNLTRRATSFASADSRPKHDDEHSSARAWASGDVMFEDNDDDYLYSILKTLRAGMDAEKLVPPGEVYIVEMQTVFQEGRDGGVDIKPATRVTTRVVQDVEKRFGEIGFGRGMFSDHNPANYEGTLEMLLRGVCDEEVEFT